MVKGDRYTWPQHLVLAVLPNQSHLSRDTEISSTRNTSRSYPMLGLVVCPWVVGRGLDSVTIILEDSFRLPLPQNTGWF